MTQFIVVANTFGGHFGPFSSANDARSFIRAINAAHRKCNDLDNDGAYYIERAENAHKPIESAEGWLATVRAAKRN